MRTALLIAASLAAALFSDAAHAQFANRSLGGGLGFVKVGGGGCGSATPCPVGVDFALPLTLEGTLYIENGFDVYAHIPLMIVSVGSGAPTTTGRGLVFATGGHLGVRYLFMEETLRPYLGLELAGFVLFTQPTAVFVGPGISGGLDYFVADSVSIGLRGFFDLFIELNQPVRPSFGGGIGVATYF